LKGITVIIIGTGRFGRHYSRILSTLNGEKILGVPPIDTLIVTKTELKRAQEMAHLLSTQHQDTIPNVIGAKVSHKKDLSALLDQVNPDLTCIVASDRVRGDIVHAEYADIALKKGKVLCEKPFSGASGDGSSLKLLKKLSTYPNADYFGLELPLIIARQQLLSHAPFQKHLLKTNKLDLHWGAKQFRSSDIIVDLALHPWSLIPEYIEVKEMAITNNSEMTKTFKGSVYNTREKRKVDMCLTLSGENNFRALEIDGITLAFQSEGPSLNIVKLPYSINEAANKEFHYKDMPVLDTIHNPLDHHIIACLKGSPIVGLKKAYQSQLFLEMLKGFK
jgi:Oxidoreductase family, NAD-binding Rossmann fold